MVKIMMPLLICLFLCIGTTACKPGKAVDTGDKVIKEDPEIKYNAYIALSDYMNGEFATCLNYYFAKFGYEYGAMIDNHGGFSLYPVSKSGRQISETAYKSSAEKPVYTEVDALVKELYPKMSELMNLLDEAYSYDVLKSYEDDNFIKAKELHGKVIASYDAYQPLYDRFTSGIYAVVAQQRKKDLENFRKNDQLLSYYCLSVILRTEELQVEMDNQNITASNILELDLIRFKEKHNLLAEDVHRFIEYASDERRVKREGFNPNSSYYSSFMGDVTEINIAAAEIIERVEKKKNLDSFDLNNGFVLENRSGTPEKLRKKYNQAIRDYNNMITK
jgi:hypothetical protein